MSLPSKNELRKKISKLNRLEEQLKTQRTELEEKVEELENFSTTLVALEELSRKDEDHFEGFISLGSDVFVKGKVKVDREKILQEIGAGVSLALSIEETQERLKRRQRQLRDEVQEQQKELNQSIKKMQELRSEIQRLQNRFQAY